MKQELKKKLKLYDYSDTKIKKLEQLGVSEKTIDAWHILKDTLEENNLLNAFREAIKN